MSTQLSTTLEPTAVGPVRAYAAAIDEDEGHEPSLRGPLIAGISVIVAFMGTFLAWGFLASLDSAAIATGNLIVDSRRKTVQHLEGGILREILVREGDSVKAGQVLMRMDTALAGSAASQLRNQRLAAQAKLARLRAELGDGRSIVFPPELQNATKDPMVAEQISTQQALFTARLQAFESQSSVIERRIQQSREEIAAMRAQQTSSIERLKSFEEEAEAIRELVEKGYERKPRLLGLQRSAAEMRGRIGELEATMARARQTIAGAEFEMKQLRSQRQSDINRELQDAQTQEKDIADRLTAADDVLQRKDVVAPQDGKVADLKFFTSGGVIAPGAPILDIVPQEDDLIVEARVRPSDIDVVRAGLPAEIRLSAFRSRLLPLLDGEVIYVSADKMVDQRTGDSYFTARARLKKESLQEMGKLELYPGMPAEVFIVTGKRRAIDYLLSPLIDSMRRSFRED